MGTALVFILKTGILMLAMYLVYKVLLSKGAHHGFNRAVLLSVYLLAPAIAALTPAGFSAADAAPDPAADAELVNAMIAQALAFGADTAAAPRPHTPWWPAALVALWLAGVLAVVVSTIISVLKIRRIMRRCRRLRLGRVSLLITDSPLIAPFSTMRSVVINERDAHESSRMILTHELRHIALLHWVDLIVSRAAIALSWFNPAVWLLADELRVIHEYQADNAVIHSGADARSYQLLLIRKAAGVSEMPLVCGLGQKLIRSRITMMLGARGRTDRRWCVIFMLPALSLSLFAAALPSVSEMTGLISSADVFAPFSYSSGPAPAPATVPAVSDTPVFNVVRHADPVTSPAPDAPSAPEKPVIETERIASAPAVSEAEAIPTPDDHDAPVSSPEQPAVTSVATSAKTPDHGSGREDAPVVAIPLRGNDNCDTRIYVDNILQTNIDWLTTDDIESIEVRKDENVGHVFIYTKKGSASRKIIDSLGGAPYNAHSIPVDNPGSADAPDNN